jgi:hypothetical protein
MSAIINWTAADTQRAIGIWTNYQATHDVSASVGQTAGIEPDTGRVWFGSSAQDIARQMEAAGGQRPFYAVRVGADHYVRKGGRR